MAAADWEIDEILECIRRQSIYDYRIVLKIVLDPRQVFRRRVSESNLRETIEVGAGS